MRQLFLLIFAASCGMNALAQAEDTALKHPYHQAQIGWIISDVFLPAASFELGYNLNKSHGLGLYYSSPGWASSNSSFYDDLNNGNGFGLWHRFSFGYDENNQEFFFVKHGARFHSASLGYSVTDWFPYEENGNTFYTLEERDFRDQIIRFSYFAAVGLQTVTGPIYIEYYAGLQYQAIVNEEEVQAPLNDSFIPENMNPWLRVGVSPVIGIVMGLGY